MRRALRLCLVFFIPALLLADEPDGPPSDGALGMRGALGTIHFRPTDWIGIRGPYDHPDDPEAPITYWIDSDGVDPGTAGCHLGVTEKGECNERMFGEACLPNGLLVESNPGVGQRHSHGNDVGHPDTFDCYWWCIGEGFGDGACVKAPAESTTLCPKSCKESARCLCSEKPRDP